VCPEDCVRSELRDELLSKHGSLLSGSDLSTLLGFPSISALNQAARRGKLGIRTFKVGGRPGRFALTLDVVDWLMSLRT
jgi:hypothetical protein